MPAKKTATSLALFAIALCLALPASAQIYQWKDSNGKTVMSDKPPPGKVPASKPTDPDAAAAPAPAQPAAPQAPAWVDQEMAFRKRQLEAREQAEKEAKEAADAAIRSENCQKMSRWLQRLESGQRMSSLNDKGERQFMDDTQRAQEADNLRRSYESQCQ